MNSEPFRSFFALSEAVGTLSLFGQLAATALAFGVSRFIMRSRRTIFLASFLGALGAMAANIMVDGQGAFLLLGLTPIIYFAAVVGRRDLRAT